MAYKPFVNRFCRGGAAACVFLNKGELDDLRLLLRSTLEGEFAVPNMSTLRRILDGIDPARKES